MSFYQTLQAGTAIERERLLSAPIIQDALGDRISRAQYLGFLREAYHHVKHTVPLLMACGARLPASREWLRVAIAEYIAEETGHQEWILNDIAAAGGNADEVRSGQPHASTELMVAYAYGTIMRGNPVRDGASAGRHERVDSDQGRGSYQPHSEPPETGVHLSLFTW